MFRWCKRTTSRRTVTVAVVLVLVLVIAVVYGWNVLVHYIDPQDATDRKDAIQVYAIIVAGVVAAITATVGLLNLRLTHRNLEQQRELEEGRAAHQRELEDKRSQGDALQAYYEQIGKLITGYDLLSTRRNEIRELARGQTLTVLQAIDGTGRVSLLNFLYGAGLIGPNNRAVSLIGANFRGIHLEEANLEGAILNGADFRDAFLSRANLLGTDFAAANLREADLAGAFLRKAHLEAANLLGANLQKANLRGAQLQEAIIQRANFEGADLIGANLQGADLGMANLQGADLAGANLEGAQLQGAFLQGADLKRANLQGANLGGVLLEGAELQEAILYKARGVTNHRLSTVTKSIDGAIMTDGQTYEEWREDLENRMRGEA